MTRVAQALMVSILWLAPAKPSLSQNPPERQPCPDATAEAVGCELIAWSHLQEPVPLPLTPPDDRQPGDPERQERVSTQNAERHESSQIVDDHAIDHRAAVLVETERRTGSPNR
jgi:hypothetical protein